MTATRYAFAALVVACGLGAGVMVRIAYGQPTPTHGAAPAEEGKRVFMRANCIGCHKWHGGGGGGYGGAALSLRNTELTREQIIETVNCGRPGAGMPYFLRDAYDGTHCSSLTKQDLEENMPPEPPVFLRTSEIAAVADYVMTHIKGWGEPTYAECIEFFGPGSRVCNTYKKEE